MTDKDKRMKEAQDEVQEFSTDLVTKETLLAVSIVAVVTIIMWLMSWFTYVSNL